MANIHLDLAESLTVHQIIMFCEVYEHGGYAKAAKSLDLAAPTIWEQVKTLEKIYKTKLFARSGRNVVPTAIAHTLYDMLRPLLASVESTFERLAEETDVTIGLVVGVRMMLEDIGIPLRQFQVAFPDARLKLMTADNATAQQLVLDGTADLSLMIEPSQEVIAKGIAYEVLYPVEYLVVLPPRHRLVGKQNFTLLDLADEPLVVGTPQTIVRKMLEQLRFQQGIRSPLRIAAEADNSAITIACVQAGLGIGVIGGRPNGKLTKNLTTHSLAKVNVVAAYREGRQLTGVLQKLVDLIRSIE